MIEFINMMITNHPVVATIYFICAILGAIIVSLVAWGVLNECIFEPINRRKYKKIAISDNTREELASLHRVLSAKCSRIDNYSREVDILKKFIASSSKHFIEKDSEYEKRIIELKELLKADANAVEYRYRYSFKLYGNEASIEPTEWFKNEAEVRLAHDGMGISDVKEIESKIFIKEAE